MSMFSDLWQVDEDNEDLEGAEELRFDRALSAKGERHGYDHEHSRDDLRRSKRNLMLGLVGMVLIVGGLWIAISHLG